MTTLKKVIRDMVHDLFGEEKDPTPEWVEKGIREAVECQTRPEDMDRSRGITLETTPPLRSKIPVKMSEEDEEDMENLVFVHDVHTE
jgi:hypothetical protein